MIFARLFPRSDWGSFLVQLLSPQITATMPGAALQRCKTLAKEAGKRLPEVRNKAVIVEIERGSR